MKQELLNRLRDIQNHITPKGYKKTDVGIVPQEWEIVKLGDIISIKSGNALTALKMNKSGNIPVYGGNGITGYHDNYNINKPTLVIGRVGIYCGNTFITEKQAWITDNAFITTFDETLIYLNWLKSYIDYLELRKKAGSTAQPVISGKLIYPLPLPLPPLAEQQAIAEILSTQDRVIELQTQLIEQKRLQKKALMQQLLSGKHRLPGFSGEWKQVQIKELGTCCAGATPKTDIIEYWEGGTISWMSSGEVHKKVVYNTDTKITEKGYNNSSTKMIPINSIVIALAGQGKTRGTVALTKIELCTNQSLCAITPNNKICYYEYLYHYLDSQYLELRLLSSGDGSRGGLNLQIINSLFILLPPLAEQEAIAEILSDADREIELLEARLETEKQKKRGLMQVLLTGAVRVA